MKKSIIVALLLIGMISGVALAETIDQITAYIVDFQIEVDGENKEFDMPIVAISDRTYLPLREMADTLGIDIKWIENERKIVVSTDPLRGEDWSVFEENGLFGYKDAKGNVVIEAQFTHAEEFSEGLAAASVDTGILKKYGYIDTTGNFVLQAKYNLPGTFKNGIALVSDALEEYATDSWVYYFIDPSGNILGNQKYVLAHDFSEGYADVLIEGDPILSNQKWSYIDETGERATELTFELTTPFKNGHAIVKNNGKWGVIDQTFHYVVECQYDQLPVEGVDW